MVLSKILMMKLMLIGGVNEKKTSPAPPKPARVCDQGWKTDRFLGPFRPGALFCVASYPRPGLSP